VGKLSPRQQEMIALLPDCGGSDRWRLDRRVLDALVKKGFAARCYINRTANSSFDRFCRTREARIALWGDDQITAGTPLAEFSETLCDAGRAALTSEQKR
jgi:hypothetical protein